MTTNAPPEVPRFNPWGQWQPIIARCSQEQYFRTLSAADTLPSRPARAVYLYCEFTSFTGIEFVVVSTGRDEAPYRRYANGALLVPCQQPHHPLGNPIPLYDGWLPLSDSRPETIAAGLQTIDEIVTVSAHILGASGRWVTKYLETVDRSTPIVHVTDSEHESLQRALQRLRELPTPLQAAVLRSVHWMQHAAVQLRPTDTLLSLWQALESVLLATYEHASDLELTLSSMPSNLSRKMRRERTVEHVKRILAEEQDKDPIRAVTRSYFEAVVGIRRRCEAVLHALLGDGDPRTPWLFDSSATAWSPSAIRNQIMHEGRSAVEIEASCDVLERTERLRRLASEVVLRVLTRRFNGDAFGSRKQTMSVGMLAANSIIWGSGPGVSSVGDFSISLPLLLTKGLL